ncbi:MAG: transposase family protein [bacterium]|nr:transposase family protein [bacterium]
MEEVIRKAPTFMELLHQIEDPRDNRGKRHELACVLACVIVAMLSDKSSMSSIHRFIRDRIEWLREIVQRSTVKVVPRAQ